MIRFLRFGVVGVVGFVVDAGTLLLLVRFAALSPLPARIISFITAASVTFLLNQRFTFRIAGPFSIRRWSFYLLTTTLGACVNVGVYHAWISYNGVAPLQLILGTAIGSLIAMSVNYLLSATLVFSQAKSAASAIR